MSSNYYFNTLGEGFVVLGGLMLVEMILKQQHMLLGTLNYPFKTNWIIMILEFI